MDKEVVEIKNAERNPFRVFSKIEYAWYTSPEECGGLEFYIRPWKAPELAMYRSIEQGVKSETSKRYNESMERLGYTWEDIHGEASTKEEEEKQTALFAEVMQNIEPIPHEMNMEVEQNTIKALSFAVSEVRSGEETMTVTEELLQSINSVKLMAWLVNKVKEISTLTDSERVSL